MYGSLQKPMKLEEIEKGLAQLMLIQEWLNIWKQQGKNSKPHPYHWALITSYEATDLLKYLYYIYQGRKERNNSQLKSMIGDLLVMSMTLCDDLNFDIHEVMKEALTRLENLEYQKSFGKK